MQYKRSDRLALEIQRTLADILLACSMALSMTALIWYGFVMLKRIKRSILHSEPQLKTV